MGGTAVYLSQRRPASAEIVRFSVNLPGGQSFINRRTIAISPDGSQIVFATPFGLHLRPLAESETKIIRGTESFFNITEPAFSPDGRFIAFHSGGDRTLKRIPVTGGAALTICPVLSPSGLSWQREGIVYTSMSLEPSGWSVRSDRATAKFFDLILVVQPDGGSPKTLVRVHKGEIVHRPQFLPGGRHLLFTLANTSSPHIWDSARIVAQDLRTGQRTTILENASDARYVPTGHLVYAVSGSLFAIAFDPKRLTTMGGAAPVLEAILFT
jgi:serine/threonine-protein kinase